MYLLLVVTMCYCFALLHLLPYPEQALGVVIVNKSFNSSQWVFVIPGSLKELDLFSGPFLL